MITSPHNERVKLVRALQNQPKTRRKEGKIALEGVRLIGDAFAAGWLPEFVLYTAESITSERPGRALFAALHAAGLLCLEVSPDVMAHAAETQTPQGMIAVVRIPTLALPPAPTLALILDGVADPGNLGTMLRTAAAAGVDMTLLAPGCVDPYNPKALRSGMGAHFRVPLSARTWPEIRAALAGLPTYVADASGTLPYYTVDWTRPAALVIGGEARGADDQAREQATGVVCIPMANRSESLNAAAAAAVILFEIRRQRLAAL